MMRKLFDHFIDREGCGVEDIAAELGVGMADLLLVRLVSYHPRLLGVLHRGREEDRLVLVDFDDTKQREAPGLDHLRDG